MIVNNNRYQLLNDRQEASRIMLEGWQVGMWTAIPGIIQSVEFANMTCVVQPALQAIVVDENGLQKAVDLPLLLDVPIVFPSGGGFLTTFPLAAGNEVLVVFSSRCIDAWWQSGGIQQAMEARMHDLSDGFAIPGPSSVPNVAGSIDTSRYQIRNKAGTVYFSMGTKFAVKNATTDLKTVLTELTSAINNFMATLAALTPPTTPVLNSVLQIPATAAVAALATVTSEINALLENS